MTEQERNLTELVKPGDTAMITTAAITGQLTSRPMTVAACDDRQLRFLVASDASWVEELAPGARVNAAIIASGRNDWVSVSGTATVRIDAAEIEELWSPAATAYFEGPEDPRVGVLHIAVEGGEYWDAPGGGPFGRLLSMISAKLGRDEQNEQGPIRGGE